MTREELAEHKESFKANKISAYILVLFQSMYITTLEEKIEALLQENLQGYKEKGAWQFKNDIATMTNMDCSTCKHCDGTREALIHCKHFEQFFPIGIGFCGQWKQKQ